MSLLDLIKDIPHVLTLKDKVAEAEAKQAALETENAILKDDLRQAKAEIVKFKEELERLTHKPDLHEKEIKILAHLLRLERRTRAHYLIC